jgi:hypothetical protein
VAVQAVGTGVQGHRGAATRSQPETVPVVGHPAPPW